MVNAYIGLDSKPKVVTMIPPPYMNWTCPASCPAFNGKNKEVAKACVIDCILPKIVPELTASVGLPPPINLFKFFGGPDNTNKSLMPGLHPDCDGYTAIASFLAKQIFSHAMPQAGLRIAGEEEAEAPPKQVVGPFDSKMPEHSWATLPVAYHGASYTGFSDASVALLAKFPSVTLEKCQGWKKFTPPCNGFGCTSCCEEDVYAALGKRIKSLNPKTKVIAYFHSNKAMPWYHIARVVDNDTAACYNGDDMHATAPCIAADNKYGDYFFDFRKQAGANAYLEGCRNMTKTGFVDGCFVDGCLKIEAPIGKAIKPAFTAAKMATLKELQLSVPGPLICGSGGGECGRDMIRLPPSCPPCGRVVECMSRVFV